jgi:8-oxo-dGTP pyrophosphatase MutT (NUDIX family)
MKPGETVRQAAVRCVLEELGVRVGEESARPDETPTVKVETSPSYAGLPTRYTFYDCEVDVPGLPEGPFSTREDGDKVSLHHWEWRGENGMQMGLERR